jgi:CheY-like chemotaxis protein
VVSGSRAEPVTVLTVDDQPAFLRAARELIAAADGFRLVGEAESGAQALRLAKKVRPDLILLDVRMPGMDGVETARRLEAAAPGATIVFMSLEDRPPAAAPDGCDGPAHIRKQDLSVRALKALWRSHGRRREPA